ncbi:MAG: hypothetical protein JXQ71_15390 [Verrucomicrobia bacterium]|nr:hypothetical protein [Verrucomicrobiota bacterium]
MINRSWAFAPLVLSLLPWPATAVTPPPTLACDRDEVFAGERVTVHGSRPHAVQIPADARPGQRLWINREGAWIDFTVVPLAEAAIELEGTRLKTRFTSRNPQAAEFTLAMTWGEGPHAKRLVAVEHPQGVPLPASPSARTPGQTLRLDPRLPRDLACELDPPREAATNTLRIELTRDGLSRRWEHRLRAVRGTVPLMPLPERFTRGLCRRGHAETAEFGETAAVVEPRHVVSGGAPKNALFMHPPYQGGVGYCFALYPDIALPAAPAAAFRAMVGKGDGSDLGDGIVYRVAVVVAQGAETLVGERVVTRHAWLPLAVDLSRWAGRRVALKLIADVGSRDDSTGDWGCWGDMRLETLEPRWRWVLDGTGRAGGSR